MKRHRLVACVKEMTEENTEETSSTPDTVISSSSVLKPEPLSECPDENLMSRTYQPEYHHMDFMTIQQGMKQEPGTFDSPDTVVGYQSWQESKLLENVSLKEELIVLSGKTEDQQVPTPQPNLQQPGDGIKCERMKLESARCEDPSDWYIGIPGKLEKEIVECAEVREGNTHLVEPCAQKPPVTVALYRQNAKQALYRHIAKRMSTVENYNQAYDNLKSQGEKQIILSCSPAMSSYVTSVDNVTHHGDERNDGSLCGNKSVIKSLLEQKSPRIREIQLKCTACEYRFTNSNSLAVHMETHTDEKSLRCSICCHEFSRKWSLTSHMRTHTNEKPLKCSICYHEFSRKWSLTSHMRTHTGEKPYICTICDYRSNNNSDLVVHMRRHTGEKPYKCTFCDLRCSKKSDLTRHMKTHTGEKPFRCTVCEYRVTDKNSLALHVRTHTDEKPLRCSICFHKFSRKWSLTSHMRTHSGEKPYMCTICDYRSVNNRDLVVHMRKHSGEKPYKCNFCDFKSTKKSCLTAHLRQHTDAKPIE